MAVRRVVIVCFPGVELLDVAGPASVFASASTLSPEPAYRVELVAQTAGAVTSSCGVTLQATRGVAHLRGKIDTLLVPGGLAPALAAGRGLVHSLPALARRARRITSVCSGAFLLAEAGLLRGKRVTTHWAGTQELASRHPDLEVERDSIFVRDGEVWTSAGVTAGIDLALALVAQDLGAALALEVARWGVMYLRRPGGQGQFSAPLRAQQAGDEQIASLVTWMTENLRRDLCVDALARRTHMSGRNFARVFRREVGTTPAQLVEQLRLEAARRSLELSARSVKQIAVEVGFGSAESMHRVFRRVLAVTPQAYRERFQVRDPPAKGGRRRTQSVSG
jgi:transcriptional regulator GlxA family with amidase domain